MTLIELSHPSISGDKVRLKLLTTGAQFERQRIIEELERRIGEHDPELTGTGPCACIGYEAVIEWLREEQND
jgi:hypothetical protein